MDDFIAVLLCLPFLILPLIVLVAIISRKIKSSGTVKGMWVTLHSHKRGNQHKAADFPKQKHESPPLNSEGRGISSLSRNHVSWYRFYSGTSLVISKTLVSSETHFSLSTPMEARIITTVFMAKPVW